MKRTTGAGCTSIHVLIADSNQTQSQLLGSALRRQPGLVITSCRSDLSACLQALRSSPADIVLLGDAASDQLIETLRGLHSSYPDVRVILLTDSCDRAPVVTALRAGARGLFCRQCQPFRALCRCISVIHQGQFWANTEQIGYVIEELTSGPSPRVTNVKGVVLLTPREEQVVSLVSEGIGNRQIAQYLHIKESSVKKYLLHIYDKLGVSNRVELVLYALTHRGPEIDTPAAATRQAASEAPELHHVESAHVGVLSRDQVPS